MEFIPVAYQPSTGPHPVHMRDQFSRYTQILRIPLEEKANAPLGDAEGQGNWRPEIPGICGLLLQGLKNGAWDAIASHDLQTPVHYGDLLELVYHRYPEALPGQQAPEDTVFGKVSANYWSPDPAYLAGFGAYVELITDELFDKRTGRKRQHIRYLRLLWVDEQGVMPDYAVAVFPWDQVAPTLEGVMVSDPRNEARQMSLRDFIETQSYHCFTVERSDRSPRSLQETRHQAQKQLQLENYHWSN